MRKKDAKIMLQKYLEGKCTPSETKLVESWLDQQADSNQWQWGGEEEALHSRKKIKEGLVQRMRQDKRKDRVRRVLLPLSAAACLLILVVAGYHLWTTPKDDSQYLSVRNVTPHIVEPGSQSAILTLGDGSVVYLDDIHNGILEHSDGLKILQDLEGQLVYETTAQQTSHRADTNRISIPFGGFYKVILNDGTKVSLNSGSTLTYPTQFTGKHRKVKLIGEAFFEVSSNKEQPFVVIAKDNEITVTGTSFNVSAYGEEEKTITTLLEGEVYVSKENTKAVRLSPNEQSSSIFGSSQISKKRVDGVSSIAWLEGYFVFDDQEIESVLRQISRWYDVDIYIERSTAQDKKIGGTFARQKNIDDLLHYLNKLNVIEFKKQGRRITVMI